MESYVKCSSCRGWRNQATEFEVYKGTRRATCILCKEKRHKLKCEHNRERSKCIECGGVSICEHQRVKTQCVECHGGSVCLHQRIRSKCIECGGGSICLHKRERSKCIECHGGSVCLHQRIRSQCVECGGGSICLHQRIRACCKDCQGSQICQHQRRRSQCVECHGGSVCLHQRQRSACKECSPSTVIINLIRHHIRRCFNLSTVDKINRSIEYLGCDIETLKTHILAKMTAEMTFDNIHYDHIKPVSRFDLDDESEFLKCCHYTNLQPLLAKDNVRLSNMWTDENELFWNEHILYKPDFKDLYKLDTST